VHDDLPAMDDDDLRRGKPSCHIAFDEATAILAGDALQTLAFEVITKAPIEAEKRLQMISILAHASGAQGMVAGQMLDIQATQQLLSQEQLETLQQLKTGALITASIELGQCASNDVSATEQASLQKISQSLGLLFQIQDDILDVEGDTDTMGKQQGSDQAKAKSTYPALLGMAAAKSLHRDLYTSIIESLSQFDRDTETLSQLVHFVADRQH